MTNNINNVLSTIISRCNVIKLNNNIDNNFVVDKDLENLAIDFVYHMEKNWVDTLINIKDIWFSKVAAKERDKMLVVFDLMIDIYYDMMKIITGNKKYKCKFLEDKIIELSKLNNLDKILEKINILIDAKDSIKFNVNSNLLIDSIIISILSNIFQNSYSLPNVLNDLHNVGVSNVFL